MLRRTALPRFSIAQTFVLFPRSYSSMKNPHRKRIFHPNKLNHPKQAQLTPEEKELLLEGARASKRRDEQERIKEEEARDKEAAQAARPWFQKAWYKLKPRMA